MKKIYLMILFLGFLQAKAQFSEDFESVVEGGIPPGGWKIKREGGLYQWEVLAFSNDPWYRQLNVGAFGGYFNNTYCIVPKIKVIQGVNDRITFWGRMDFNTDGRYFEVVLSSKSNSTGDFKTALLPSTRPNLQ